MGLETSVVFNLTSKPELGYLVWNQLSTFTICDRNMNEVDQFKQYGVYTNADAVQVALEHFEELEKSNE